MRFILTRKTPNMLVFSYAVFLLIPWALLAGCQKPLPEAEPVVCDITKIAYQSPAFVDQYFMWRQHADYSGKFDLTHRYTRNFEYAGNKSSPGILVSFYHNKAIEVDVFFFEQQTPEDRARRVGLKLSDFHTIERDNWKQELAGNSHGIAFKSVVLTNISNQQQNATWNIITKLDNPYNTVQHGTKKP